MNDRSDQPVADPEQICPCCGRPVGGLSREIKMGPPDIAFDLTDEERDRRLIRMGGSLLSVDGSHFFIRALLPVRLTDGHEYHFGVWTELEEPEWQEVLRIRDDPGYLKLNMAGKLANGVPPWGEAILGADARLATRAQDQLPYVISSLDPTLAAVLSTPWPDEECLALIEQVWGPAGKPDG